MGVPESITGSVTLEKPKTGLPRQAANTPCTWHDEVEQPDLALRIHNAHAHIAHIHMLLTTSVRF